MFVVKISSCHGFRVWVLRCESVLRNISPAVDVFGFSKEIVFAKELNFVDLFCTILISYWLYLWRQQDLRENKNLRQLIRTTLVIYYHEKGGNGIL